jgi:hypothetical protein
MEHRIPETFFDARLAEQVTRLLQRLSPPATEVMLCHMDAPGWRVVDLRGGDSVLHAAGSRPRNPIGSMMNGPVASLLVLAAPEVFVDRALSLRATLQGHRLFWEWNPVPRCSAYGWFPAERSWDELRKLVAAIASPMRSAFAYHG